MDACNCLLFQEVVILRLPRHVYSSSVRRKLLIITQLRLLYDNWRRRTRLNDGAGC